MSDTSANFVHTNRYIAVL